jgi:hypothetical protein
MAPRVKLVVASRVGQRSTAITIAIGRRTESILTPCERRAFSFELNEGSIILIEAGAPDRMRLPTIQGGAWQKHSVLRSVSASAPNSGGATLASPPPRPAQTTNLGLAAQHLQALERRPVGPQNRHSRCSALIHHGQRPGDGRDGE